MTGGRQAAIAQASLGFVLTSLGACLVLVARDLGLPAGRLAGLSATVGIGLLVVGAAGPWLLRRGPYPVLRGGAIATAAGCVLFATGFTLPIVVGGVLLLGAGAAALILVTPALLAGPRAAERITRVNAVGSACAVIAPIGVGALDTTGVSGRLALLPLVVPLAALAVSRPAGALSDAGVALSDARVALSDAGVALSDARVAFSDARVAFSDVRPDRGRVARRWSSIVLAVSVEFCFTIWAVARLHDTGVPAGVAALLGSSFPAGMAIGRFLGSALLTRLPAVAAGGAVTCVAAVAVVVGQSTAVVTIGLVGAGVGIATLYPVTLAELVGTPGLAPRHGVSLAAVASGTAILTAPTALAVVARHTGLRVAFLITIPLIAAVVLAHGRRRAAMMVR